MGNNIIKEAKLHHSGVSAIDFEKTVEFYTKGLGMTIHHVWADGTAAMLDIGNGSYIEIFSYGKKCPVDNLSWTHLAIETSDVDGAYEAALAAGATDNAKPVDAEFCRIAFVYGLNNEIIEFFKFL